MQTLPELAPLVPKLRLGNALEGSSRFPETKRSFAERGSQAGAWEPAKLRRDDGKCPVGTHAAKTTWPVVTVVRDRVISGCFCIRYAIGHQRGFGERDSRLQSFLVFLTPYLVYSKGVLTSAC